MKLSKIIKITFIVFSISIGIGAAVLYCVFPKPYSVDVDKNATEFCVDPALVYSVIRAESGFKQDAVSEAGAIGLMQIMPETSDFIQSVLNEKMDVFDASDNIRMGIYYLSYLQKKFSSVSLIAAAYNAGEGAVLKWIRQFGTDNKGNLCCVPYSETQKYITKIKFFYKCYKILY